MKKIIAVLMVLCCLAPVFAGSNMIGGNVGMKFGSSTTGEGALEQKYSWSYLDFAVEGTSMLNDSMGISYGLGLEKVLSLSVNGTKYTSEQISEYSLTFGAFGQFTYRVDISDEFKVDASAGLNFRNGSLKAGTDNSYIKTSTTNIGLVADAKAIYFLNDNIALFGGVGVECPVLRMTSVNTVALGNSISTSSETEGTFDFYFTAKLGASYAF